MKEPQYLIQHSRQYLPGNRAAFRLHARFDQLEIPIAKIAPEKFPGGVYCRSDAVQGGKRGCVAALAIGVSLVTGLLHIMRCLRFLQRLLRYQTP